MRAAQLILDVHADDLIKRSLGAKAKRDRAPRIEATRPAVHDLHDHRIWLMPDARDDLIAGDATERGDLFADRAANAWHGEPDAAPELRACE